MTHEPAHDSQPTSETRAITPPEIPVEPTVGEALSSAPSSALVTGQIEPMQMTPESEAEISEEPTENFADVLAQFEQSHAHQQRGVAKQLQGTVISVTPEQVFLDIGYKIEGVLPRSAFGNNADSVAPGQAFPVSITGRNEEGYYQLSRFKVAQPTDWASLQQAFDNKLAVVGTVTAIVKGGASVDVGAAVPAKPPNSMPWWDSRSPAALPSSMYRTRT